MLKSILVKILDPWKLRGKQVYAHREQTKTLARKLDKNDVLMWLLEVGYYPEPYLLPPLFNVSSFDSDGPYLKDPDYENRKKLKWREQVKVAYPNEGLTSRVFALIHPKYYHDLSVLCAGNFSKFIESYKSKRIFSYTFPIPLDSNNPGSINNKRSERQIYEYIDAAEKSLLVDSLDYKYVVIADIKQFYPSIYTHAISWAIHTKEVSRRNRDDLSFIGHKIDKLLQCSNDGKTNGVAIGPAISDIISEWMLNAVDANIDKKLPGRSFGIRYKDDYRIVCDSEEESKVIIKSIQESLLEFDLNLSEEKTSVELLPDGLYRPWMLEYDQFEQALLGERRNKSISFKSYTILQRKIFLMNKNYAAKGLSEKFLGRLLDDDYSLLVTFKNITQKKLFIANLIRLVRQKPKVIGQALGLIELTLDKETKAMIEDALNGLIRDNEDNEFMLSWLLYFKKKHRLKLKIGHHKDMPLLESVHKNKQMFFSDFKGAKLTKNIKTIDMTLAAHTALFKKGL